ncbi:MAG TPA: NAD-dependent epimerase/dehydratase family protein [Solirubrobacteraceae bacterium]|nr:NAD-dependent epimerase/dehydratase family protein [Solirubrobacteraceae bacterium]
MKHAVITGAHGYLGSLLRARLEADGWTTTSLVRRWRAGERAERWALGEVPDLRVFEGADALVHCAWDFRPRKPRGVWSANVHGSKVLLRAAHRAGVPRLLSLSSMSAYAGTAQHYGRAKLELERVTLELGGIAVRPGLVYGEAPAGMAGALHKLTRLPLVPVIGGASARQFPVHEDDLADALVRILDADTWTSEVIGIAQPASVGFRELLQGFARQLSRQPRFFPVPWQLVFWTLRLAEAVQLPVPLRADSVLGLVHPAPSVPPSAAFPDLHASLRRFASDRGERMPTTSEVTS